MTSNPVLNREVSDLVHLVETGPHSIAVDAFDRNDRRVRAGTYAPDMKVGDPGISRSFDKFTDFLFEMAFMRVEQNARRVTH